jgi:hypothetical protein
VDRISAGGDTDVVVSSSVAGAAANAIGDSLTKASANARLYAHVIDDDAAADANINTRSYACFCKLRADQFIIVNEFAVR